MKRFKQTDAWISVFMIIGFPLMGIITRNEYYFTGYFFVGGWQLISMFVHFYSGWFMSKGGKRNLYHRVVLAVLCIWGISFAYAPALLLLLYAMLIAGPIMAIIYTSICFIELRAMESRPLSQLK